MELINLEEIREPKSEEEINKAREIIKSGGGLNLSELFQKINGFEPERHHLDRLIESLQFSALCGQKINLEQLVVNCLELDDFQ